MHGESECRSGLEKNLFLRLGKRVFKSRQNQQMPELQTGSVINCDSWRDRVLLVFYHLSVGSDVSDTYPLFGISEATCRKYFIVYLLALRFFLMTESPWSSFDLIERCTPKKILNVIKNLESIGDLHEQECASFASLKVANTFWSQYKKKMTCKFWGAISPSGFGLPLDSPVDGKVRDLDEAEPRPGRCTDEEHCEGNKHHKRVTPGKVSLADKGVTAQGLYAREKHLLRLPFQKRRNIPSFSQMEMYSMTDTAPIRIHVERFFRRVQEFKIWREKIPAQHIDLVSAMWSVCYHLCNFGPDLIRVLEEEDEADTE
jgi:hypothetical protein